MEKANGLTLFRIIGAMFLIAGTCVGGGMLALPVSGGRSGFLPSTTVMIVAWAFMTITGLLYVEVCMWLKGDAHIISMASKLLGNKAKYLCWLIYLFIGYASLVAYLSEGGKLTANLLSAFLSREIDKTVGCFIYLLPFAGILWLGARGLGRLNSLLVCCMAGAFILLVGSGTSAVQSELLMQQRWQAPEMLSLFPLMLTTFSYPGLVPVVVANVERNRKHARVAIIGGTTLTFLTYFVWMFVILGTVPNEGEAGLQAAYAMDHSAAMCLQELVQNPMIASFAQAFGFFALTTSFLGISWGLLHFWADGLKIPKLGRGKFVLASLVLLPSLGLTLGFEKVFYTALEVSGGIGDAVISGIVPACMVWVGRYRKNYAGSETGNGGKLSLALIIAVSLVALCYEVGHRL